MAIFYDNEFVTMNHQNYFNDQGGVYYEYAHHPSLPPPHKKKPGSLIVIIFGTMRGIAKS